jgi:Ca2+-binding RTX toxin-like protein
MVTSSPGNLQTVPTLLGFEPIAVVYIGTDRSEFIVGGSANEKLVGLDGNDVLIGDAGNDVLVGGAGADMLNGGVGFDVASYEGAAAAVTANLTLPGSNQGEALGDRFSFVEGLVGSRFADRLTGNSSGNVVLGGGSADVIDGLAGDDLLVGDSGNDRLSGDIGRDRLAGGAGDDVLAGGRDDDVFAGGLGVDVLAGSLGNDVFVFNAPLSSANRDVVTDFANAAGNNDLFRLENAVMTRLGLGVHALAPGFFRAGASAVDADDFVIYDRATGRLFYDMNANLSGGLVLLATLTNKPLLTAVDFEVF